MTEQADNQQMILQQLVRLSRLGMCCDLTFRSRPPILNARLSPALASAIMYGVGAEKLARMLSSIETKTGEYFSSADVWLIVEFGRNPPSDEQLLSADISSGDIEISEGLTMRKIAADVYHCKDDAQTEQMLRRMAVS